MDYDKIIIDMLNRICILEEKIANMENNKKQEEATKIGTSEIKSYISDLKKDACENGRKDIELLANDIHKALKLKSSMPQVCNAMRQSMNEKDEIIFQTASGNSSTFKVKYCL